MFKIALPDGSVKEMPEGSTPADVAAAIGPGLAKAALAAKIDGEVRDIMRPFEGDSQPRADHLAGRGRGAGARPPRLRAHPCRGGAEPLSRHPDHLRPGDRRRLLLRLRADRRARPVHRGGAAGDRGGDAADHRRATSRWSARSGTRDDVRALFEKQGERVQGRVGDGAARGRADHHVPFRPWRGRLDRPLPRPAPRLDRQARPAVRSS